MLGRETYIVAVSGGIDSVVLLHRLMSVKPPKIRYIVAHLDHGIRSDSRLDVEFVRSLAKDYGLKFVTKRIELGPHASENTAREKRYNFLFSVASDHRADKVIVAHHQDDVLETMIVNMIRGTSPRGMIGFTNSGIIRPLMNKTKQDIRDYAEKNNIVWREDSTNEDQKYLRNYVRKNIVPRDTKVRETFIEIRNRLTDCYLEIDSLSKKMLVQTMKDGKIVRSRFVILPYKTQLELMATLLRLKGIELNRKMVEKATLASKTLPPGKHIELCGNTKLFSEKDSVYLKS